VFGGEPASPIFFENYLSASLQGVVKKTLFWFSGLLASFRGQKIWGICGQE